LSLSFSKYHGGGNDFILIDDRSLAFLCDDASFIRQLCSRRFGIGADGLVLLQPSQVADFRFRIFNADGSEASLCGNGLACMVSYLRDLGFAKETFAIETEKEVLTCALVGTKVSIRLPSPKVLYWGLCLEELEGLECFVLDTGVPHLVFFVEDLEDYPIEGMGRCLRHHSLFLPFGGVNVNFVKMGIDGAIRIRTYERGVEGETYSCGTGAAAAAIVVDQKNAQPSPLRVIPRSGESLEFFLKESAAGKEVTLLASASFVFEGSCHRFAFSV